MKRFNDEEIYFSNKEHKNIFYQLLAELPENKQNNVEYLSTLYLLSSNEEIRNHINEVFDFKKYMIKLNCLNQGWQTSGSISVVLLAFNLWNGYISDIPKSSSPVSIFENLDFNGIECALQAIRIRFRVF